MSIKIKNSNIEDGVCASCAFSATQSSHTILLRPEVVADRLKIKTNTLANWRLDGSRKIPFIKIGNAVRYRLSDIEEFLKSGLHEADVKY